MVEDNTCVTVVFTQEGEHIHSWETSLGSLDPLSMAESACCSGLVDESKSLEYIVYADLHSSGILPVLMKGQLEPFLMG